MSRAEAAGSALESGDDEALRPRFGSMPPGVGTALGRAAIDFYYHSIRLVVANLAWGTLFLLTVFVIATLGLLPAVAAGALLAVPWVGVVRLATLIVRGRDVVLSDAFTAWRRWLGPALGAGALFAVGAMILWLNILVGLFNEGLIGWALATLAAWGIVFGWLFGLAFWPLLVDPDRESIGIRAAGRLAALVVLARPIRMGGLGVVLAVVAAVSTVAIAAIVSISVAFIALAASHLVLPAADEVERRLTAASPTR